MLWLRLTVGGEVRSATGVKTLARQLLPAVVRESWRRAQLTEGREVGRRGRPLIGARTLTLLS